MADLSRSGLKQCGLVVGVEFYTGKQEMKRGCHGDFCNEKNYYLYE